MPATFQDLVALMARLRSPEGCPWDREQTYATLAPMLLEEAYEGFEAGEQEGRGRGGNGSSSRRARGGRHGTGASWTNSATSSGKRERSCAGPGASIAGR